MDVEFKIRARRADFSCGPDIVNLFAFQKRCKDYYIAQPLEMKMEVKEYAVMRPFLEINMGEAQELMNDLWDCGLRPSEGSGSAGAFKAVQDHLEDMRKIVGKKVGVEL